MRWKRSVSVQDGDWEDDCAWTSARVLIGIQMGMLLLCNKINCWTEKNCFDVCRLLDSINYF